MDNQNMLVKFKRSDLKLFVKALESSPLFKSEVRVQVIVNNLKMILEATDESRNNKDAGVE